MINIPHLAVFIDVPDSGRENAVAEYSARFFATYTRTEEAGSPPQGAQSLVTLSLVDREAVLRNLPPDVEASVKRQEKCLLDQVANAKKIPADEKLISAECGVLAAGFGICPPGTVVVIRRTNVAVVGFLYPHLRFDSGAGIVSTVTNPVGTPPRAPMQPHPGGSNAATAAGLDAMPWIDTALNTASVLSFGLPKPYGWIVPGVITFLEGLLGIMAPRGGVNPLEEVHRMMEADKIADWMNDSASLVDWINRQTGIMATNPPPAEEVMNDIKWYKSLGPFITPGHGHLFTVLRAFPDLDNFIEDKDKFFKLMTCVSIYLLGVKWGLYLTAYVSSKYQEQDDAKNFNLYNQQWRSDYTGFVEDLLGGPNFEGWVPRINRLIDERIAHRLAKISEVQRTDSDKAKWVMAGSTASNVIEHIHQSTWSDEGVSWSNYPDREPKNSPTQSRDGEARADRNAHYAQVEKEQIALFADARKLTTKWTDSINEWNKHLPPGKPPVAPAVDGNSFQPARSGGLWEKHKGDTISYAVAFYNHPDGPDKLHDKPKPGPISAWSEPVLIKGACPLLTVPVNASRLATGRHIYRKFGLEDKQRLIDMIPDDQTTSFRETAEV